jgi:hypothetical protein
MQPILQWFKREFLHVFPAFLFFFVAFGLINLTEGVVLKRGGVQFSFWTIFIASALVAKIVLVIDHFPLMQIFERRPLIWSVIWKTLVYAVAVFLLRFLIRLTPFLSTNQPWADQFKLFLESIDWTIFWAVQSWYYTLFFVFNVSREFVQVIGLEKTRRIFLGF